MIARLFLCLFLLAATTRAASAQSQSGEPMKMQAEKHFNRALKLFDVKDFAGAAGELAKAYEIDPRGDIKFAWAQAERLAGNCKKAVELYNELRDEPTLSDEDQRALLEGLERCDATAEPDPPPPDPDPRRPVVIPPPVAPLAVAEGSTWYKDPIGDALLISGIVGIGLGAGLHLVSSLDASAAADAGTYETHVALESRARNRRILALVTYGISGALLAGAGYRIYSRGKKSKGEAATAGIWATPQGGGLVVGGSF